MSKNTRNRILLTAVAALLLVVMAVGGTVAYLQAHTTEVENKFTPAAINVELHETYHPTDKNEDITEDPYFKNWSAPLIPTMEYRKNPVVTVKGDAKNVDSYLFIAVTESTNIKNYLTYTLFPDAGWTQIGTTNVWYREVSASTTDQSWHLIKDDKVTVNNLTAETMAADELELSFQAYIIQQYGFADAATAWNSVTK